MKNSIRLIALGLGLGTLAFTGCKKTFDDTTLTNNIKAALAADSAISQQPVQVAVQNGIATLTGNVTDDTAYTVAAQDAAKVEGVKTVVNDLQIANQTVAPTVTAAPTTGAAPVTRRATPDERVAIAHHQPMPGTTASAPAPPPPPAWRDVTVDSGAVIPVRITQTLSSETSQTGQPFSGIVTRDVIVDGYVAIAAGSTVNGTVVEAKDATHFAGSSDLTITLNSLRRNGKTVPVATDNYSVVGKGRGVNTAEKVGGGAAAGALIGGLLGHGKGAGIGALVGAGAGTAVQAGTRGQQVAIASESVIRFHLAQPLTVRTSDLATEADRNAPEVPVLNTRNQQ